MINSSAPTQANEDSLTALIIRECRSLGAPQEATWILNHLKLQAEERGLSIESSQILEIAESVLQRRRQHEPLAYVLGNWAFREYEFVVGPGVLIPRPETEELVEIGLARALPLYTLANRQRPFVVYDLGSGSGCIGLSFAYDLLKATAHLDAASLPVIEMHLVERSPEACAFLAQNLEKFTSDSHIARHLKISKRDFDSRVKIILDRDDWLERFEQVSQQPVRFAQIVLSNPPYLNEHEWSEIEASVKAFEPRAALVPDRDLSQAMQPYYELLDWAQRALQPGGFVLAELGPTQLEHMGQLDRRLADTPNIEKTVSTDMSGKTRFICFHLKFTEQPSKIGTIKNADTNS